MTPSVFVTSAGAGGDAPTVGRAPTLGGAAAPDRGAAKRIAAGAYDPAADPALRMGGIALKNGLVLVSERNWAAAVRETDGSISVASGPKPRLPGSGGPARMAPAARGGAGRGGPAGGARRGAAGGRAASAGVPLLRGIGRFGESLLVLALVKSRLPSAGLPLEGGRVAAALAASAAATSAVRAAAPKSAFAQEAGTALAAFIPAMFAVKNSSISGYHGAEHKVIGGREMALRAAAESGGAGAAAAARSGSAASDAEPGGSAAGDTARGDAARGDVTSGDTATVMGDSAAATKEHDRCGSNLVGPYLLATVATNMLARGRSGRKTPAASALAGAASLGLALEALRWAAKHGDSVAARLMLMPGRAIQKRLTTTEPTTEQLEVGRRALEELLRLESAGA